MWLILAALSTLATFAPIYFHRFAVPHWIVPAIGIVAWLIAPYRLYVHQENEIALLKNKLAELEQKEPKLVIHRQNRSAFYVHREPHQVAGPAAMAPLGAYLEFDLTIENKGELNSVVARFDLQIDDVGEFPKITPQPRNYIQTRNVNFGLAQDFVTRGDKVLVPGRNFVRGILPFYVEKAPADTITELHCTLTITDTNDVATKETFSLRRNGN